MNLKAIFRKYRIMYDGGTYKPYYIQRRYPPFGWKWYFYEGYFDSVKEAVDFLSACVKDKENHRFIQYV